MFQRRCCNPASREKREVELIDLGGASSFAQFRRKAGAWIKAHADNLTLVRLRKDRPFTSSDLDELQSLLIDAGVTNGEQFEQLTKMPNLPVFIRSLVGLDRKEAMQAFNDALAEYTLSASQIAFVELIVDQLTASGRLDPALLYDPPFTDRNPNGVSDLFRDSQVAKIVETIREFEPHLEAR